MSDARIAGTNKTIDLRSIVAGGMNLVAIHWQQPDFLVVTEWLKLVGTITQCEQAGSAAFCTVVWGATQVEFEAQSSAQTPVTTALAKTTAEITNESNLVALLIPFILSN